MFLPGFDVLFALSEYTRTVKWNLFVCYIVLISVFSHRIRNVFKNLGSHDLSTQNVVPFLKSLKSQTSLDQSKLVFYFVHWLTDEGIISTSRLILIACSQSVVSF